MIGRFFKHYGKTKLQQGITALNDAIVAFDPEGATEAAIAEIEENFDKLNVEYSKARQQWEQEQKEADEIVQLYNKRLAAAEYLQGQLNENPDDEQIANALTELVEALEDMRDEVRQEQQEADDAKQVMDELEQVVKLYGEKLKTARKQMTKAMRDVQRAKSEKIRAEQQAARASELAGIKKQASTLSSALESMQRQAQQAQAETDAAKRKVAMLSSNVDNNDIIAQALDNVSSSQSKKSLSDRLGDLKL